MPSSFSNRAQMGMLPPPRTGIGRLAEGGFDGFGGGLVGLAVDRRHIGLAAVMLLGFDRDAGGRDLAEIVQQLFGDNLSSDWLGTSRAEIFAVAFEGRTVLAPSPV